MVFVFIVIEYLFTVVAVNCISEDSKKPSLSFKLKDGKLEESNEHLSSSHMYMLQMNI